MALKQLPASTVQDFWDYVHKYDFTCFYTGMTLDMLDTKSPWYGVLDHWIPGDKRKIVLTSALFNEMKSYLTEDDFWYYVRQLYNHRKKWTKVRKRHLVYFNRLSQYIKIRGKRCVKCGKPVYSNHSKYCLKCFRFAYRLKHECYHVTSSAVKDLWDYIRKYGFVCYYTGMDLDTKNAKSEWYCVIDHWIPGDDRKLVLTSALINEMKTDLSEAEFWYMIEQLYNYKVKGLKVRKRRLKYWSRDYKKGRGV